MKPSVKIQVHHVYPENTIEMVSEEQIHFTTGMAILDKLETAKAIKYRKKKDSAGNTVVYGTLQIINSTDK